VLFRAITQRIVVIPYRRFRTTYGSHLQFIFMGHIPSLTDSIRSDGQEIIRRLWNPNLTAAFTRNRHSIPSASRI